ncbi:MAG TPA: Gfo/Idh/MocA family oxidoreductase [Blastocatellia bacterium]|nr:Gfo/Idh/MocA family oxidoreductase [Blastocatellia bacterium]
MSNSPFSRRNFIKQAATSPLIAGALTGRSAFAQRVPDPPGKKMGWAIVGLGNLAINQILPAFAKAEKAKVVALVSGHRDKAEKLAARYAVRPEDIYNYQNYDELKNNPRVDIIYIVLPNSMHAEYTIRGAQAGKHILSEKPMATSVKDCESMISACRQANRKLMVAYRCRYEPFNQNLIKLAQDKELIGPIRAVTSDHGFNIGDPKQWRLNKALAGGGSLMDIGIYALNAARYCTGEEPTEINAMEYTDRNDVRFREVEDMINFQLRFPSGALANCTSSYGYAGQNRIRVIGTKGWVELEPATSYTGARLRMRQGGQLTERDIQPRDHFAAEMDHLSECVMNDQTPLTPGEEGLRDLKYMTAIYEAAKTGKTVRV